MNAYVPMSKEREFQNQQREEYRFRDKVSSPCGELKLFLHCKNWKKFRSGNPTSTVIRHCNDI